MSDPTGVQSNGATRTSTAEGDRLSRQTGADVNVSMDPAQQSLADALRITFRVIQLVMVLLVVLFLFSGFDTINEGQTGIRLTFGRVKDSNLSAGRQFHMPYPIGELIKVPTGQRTLRIDRSFYPALTEGQRARGIESQAGTKRTLRPGVDGSNITGDNNVAHTDWTVVYHVDDGYEYVKNMYPDDVDAIVRAVIGRGVVQALAELSVDDLLRQSAGADEGFTEGSVIESRVRDIARASLSAIQSGIFVERVTLNERFPPLFVYTEFQSVSTAEAQAASNRENALRQSRQLLNSVAGAAHEELLELIDQYELAIASDSAEDASRLLQRIDALIDGSPTSDDRTVSGNVTRIINEARQYRTDVVATARADAARFAAKLEQYRANPEVFVTTEWRTAYQDFLSFSKAEIFPMPPDSSMIEVILNSDPEIARELERQRNQAEAEQTISNRMRDVLERRRRNAQNRGN